MPDQKTGLVITAHPGDFVWRAGGAIALHSKKGYRVKIICLSFGERGESQFAWKEPGATLEKVKQARRAEAEKAAAILGAEIEFFDAGDYPLRTTPEMFDRAVDIYRELNPAFVLTHALEDPTISIIRKPRFLRRKRASLRKRWVISPLPNTPIPRRRCSCSSRISPSSAISSRRSSSTSTMYGRRSTRRFRC